MNQEYRSPILSDYIQALIEVQNDPRFGGIILTNDDPLADYNALVYKNRDILDGNGFRIDQKVVKLENGSVRITLILLHVPSGQFRKTEIVLGREKHSPQLEENSEEVFLMSRILYEGLLGIACSNNAIEAELFGQKRKHCELIPPYDRTAEIIYFESFDNHGNSYKRKVYRKEFEKLYLGMTTEEEAEVEFEVPEHRRLSRSDIQLFLRCQRCFYNTKKLRVRLDDFDGKKYGLEKVTEALLKREFDHYRNLQKSHPIMDGSVAVRPLKHKNLDKWRTPWNPEDRYNIGGIQFQNVWENWMVYGGVDDIWLNDNKEMMVIDYKSSTNGKIYPEYQQQIEFYAWILRKRNYPISSTGYILMYRPDMNQTTFDWRLDFSPILHTIDIDDSWVQPTIYNALECLSSDVIPEAGHKSIDKRKTCNQCHYFDKLTRAISALKKNIT